MKVGINFVFVANRQHIKLSELSPIKVVEDPKNNPHITLKNKISMICCWNNKLSNRRHKNAKSSPKNN